MTLVTGIPLGLLCPQLGCSEVRPDSARLAGHLITAHRVLPDEAVRLSKRAKTSRASHEVSPSNGATDVPITTIAVYEPPAPAPEEPMPTYAPRKCEQCGKTYTPTGASARYCADCPRATKKSGPSGKKKLRPNGASDHATLAARVAELVRTYEAGQRAKAALDKIRAAMGT